MPFTFDNRPSDVPLADFIWHSHTEPDGGMFTSTAATQWEIVITRLPSELWLTLRGPETVASPAPIPKDADIIGMVFKVGTYMPHLPVSELANVQLQLPLASNNSFWLHGATWEIPNFENADTFLERLTREGLLAHEPVVEEVLNNRVPDLSQRSVERRFLRATGMTHGTLLQIRRAHQAANLLRRGVSILDTVFHVGYADQPHLTRSLRRFMGQTPREIATEAEAE